MIINYLKSAIRNIARNKGYTFINIFGLAIGIASSLAVFLWVLDEISYDRFHENTDSIYRCYRQVIWNGEGGRTYFYQSEMPYDPPSQERWQAPDGAQGYASYKVADHVKTHEAWGLGVYAFFRRRIVADSGIQAPEVPGVKFHNALVYNGSGFIRYVINKRAGGRGNPSRLVE